MICKQCGKENRQGAAFCIQCGQPLSSSLFCQKCGRENKPGAQFCIQCGKPLKKAQPETKARKSRRLKKEPPTPSMEAPEKDKASRKKSGKQAKASTVKKAEKPEPIHSTPKLKAQKSVGENKQRLFIAAGVIVIALAAVYFGVIQPGRKSPGSASEEPPVSQTDASTALDREYTKGPFQCEQDQSLIYALNFDDLEVPDWEGSFSTVSHRFDQPDGRNGVLVVTPGSSDSRITYSGRPGFAVIHFEMLRESAQMDVALEFLDSGTSRYSAGFSGDMMFLDYHDDPDIREVAAVQIPNPDGIHWEKVSVSFYESKIGVWWNDQLLAEYDDPNGVSSGHVKLVVKGDGKTALFDNLLICSLEAPYSAK